jgi:predicted nucleic acid-binding protein
MDSNIILRLFQPNHAHSPITEAAIIQLEQLGFFLCLVPQNIYEFWVVATRPVLQNGLGLSSPDARESVDSLLRQFHMLRDERGIFGNWISLVTQHQAIGKNAHDARLAAAMERHSIANLLTFNGADFKRFPSIQILDPAEIVAGKLPTQ